MAKWDHLGEEDVRTRPGPASRPRSKQRPSHQDAVPARVIALDRGRYITRLEPPQSPVHVTAKLARELGHRAVVVGDVVYLVGDVSGQKDTLARLVRVAPRTTVLRRSTEQGRGRDRVMVAGADQMVLVVALANPPARTGLIDRCLVAAYDGGMKPIIVLTKADLGSPDELRRQYQPLDVTVLATGRDRATRVIYGLDPVRQALAGHISVLVGHSGVGKSSLLNALIPEARRATGEVNQVTGRGRHTSSSAVGLELPDGGWLIDTPGVRSFGLHHVDPDRILAAFPDLAAAVQADCPRGCSHASKGVDCGLEEWAQGSAFRRSRVNSFQRLIMPQRDERT